MARFFIPRGDYCYRLVNGKRDYCPFYSVDLWHSGQENGYCSYLRKGDWDVNEEYPKNIEVDIKQGDGSYKKEMFERDRGSLFWHIGLLWDACKECGVKN